MEPWYKVATPRKEVREGRSLNPDEFAVNVDSAGSLASELRQILEELGLADVVRVE